MNTIFAGFVSPRPYPPTGLNTKLWIETVPIQIVKFSDLWLTQDGVKIAHLFSDDETKSYCGDPFPHVVLWEGRQYLEDGNHRIVRNALRGWRSARCRVFEHVNSLVRSAFRTIV